MVCVLSISTWVMDHVAARGYLSGKSMSSNLPSISRNSLNLLSVKERWVMHSSKLVVA